MCEALLLRKERESSLQQEGQMLEVLQLLGLEAASAFLKAMSGLLNACL